MNKYLNSDLPFKSFGLNHTQDTPKQKTRKIKKILKPLSNQTTP